MMHYDAMALGVKDLGLGVDILRQRMEEAQFPFLSVNVTSKGNSDLFAQEYVIRNIDGHQVAIIGVTEQGNVPEFTVADPVEALGQVLPDMKQEADIVIVLTNAPASWARKIASTMDGIDLIVVGGDEPLPAGEMTEAGTVIVHADVAMPGHAGRNMGLVTLNFNGQGEVTDYTSTIIKLMDTLEEDPEMLKWLQGVVANTKPTPATGMK